MRDINITSMIRENKTLFIIIAIGMFLLELEIFAVAAAKSGKISWVKVFNTEGSLVHEVRGSRLSEADRTYVEEFFGPLESLDIRLTSEDRPFPFRAWFVAAAGLPVAVMLLLVLFIKTYASLFYPNREDRESHGETGPPEGSRSVLDKVITQVGRYNVYTIGFLIFLSIFAYWVVPNFIAFVGKVGIDTLIRFKWFFICSALLLFGLGVWIVYLRYLLAKRSLNLQAEKEKYRISLAYDRHPDDVKQIGYEAPDAATGLNSGEKNQSIEQ